MTGEERSWLQRFIIWREKNVKEKRFILVLSFLVGIFTAFAALILKLLIHCVQNFLTENFDTTEANYQYLISGGGNLFGWVVCTLCRKG